jgi:hypothetical protein
VRERDHGRGDREERLRTRGKAVLGRGHGRDEE